MISVQPPTDIAMQTIFGAILSGFLTTFAAECKPYVKPIVDSSIEVFIRMSQELLPTPAKSHYTFNLRDVSKIFQVVIFPVSPWLLYPHHLMLQNISQACFSAPSFIDIPLGRLW